MKKTSSPVDTFIEQMDNGQQAIARILREIVRKAAPGLLETMKWGYPCYVGAGNVCSIIPYPDHVNLAFFRGAALDDPEGLLEGTGKGMRHVKLWSAKDLRKRAIADLIRAAVSVEQGE